MKIIDKIYISKYVPSSTGVLWIDLSDSSKWVTKVYLNGSWQPTQDLDKEALKKIEAIVQNYQEKIIAGVGVHIAADGKTISVDEGYGNVVTAGDVSYDSTRDTQVGSIGAKVTSLSSQIGGLDNDLQHQQNSVEISVGVTGKYVSTDGSLSTSANFNISNPIRLLAGQTIEVTAAAYITVSVISVTDSSATSYNAKVAGESSSLVSRTYKYTAGEDCYVAICSYKNAFPTSATISYSSVLMGLLSATDANDKKFGITAETMPMKYGYYTNVYASAVGGVCTLAEVEHGDYRTINVLASAGDVFYVTGKGGNAPRLWAFVELETNKILDFAGSADTGNETRLVAPKDCRFVANFHQILSNFNYGAKKENRTLGYLYNREEMTHLTALEETPLRKIDFFHGYAGILHHWGFVGDSLMGGYLENSGTSQYEYSWGQRMCAMLGVEGYNFSVGGMTAKEWIYNTQGYPTERVWSGAKLHKKQAYVIGMGVNDRGASYSIGDASTDIGTYNASTDTDTNTQTYAGYYAGIIQRLQSINPLAKIFVVTIPYNNAWANVDDYNKVVRDMATKFSNVFVIDLYKYANNYYFDKGWRDNLFDSGHYNVLGYEYAASVMVTYIDWIIRNNYAAFKNANLIPTEE